MHLDLKVAIIGLAGVMVGAFITEIFSSHRLRKQIMNESITKERKEYREFMRKSAVNFIICKNKSCREKLKYEIIMRLNPYDSKDNKLIEIMDDIINSTNDDTTCLEKEFLCSMQYLLKLDWERAKKEAGKKNIILNPILFIIECRNDQKKYRDKFRIYESLSQNGAYLDSNNKSDNESDTIIVTEN